MIIYYLLENEKVVACLDLMEWGERFEKSNPRIALCEFPGGVEVSTVFLGVDHQYGEGPPLLFETMVFGSDLDGEQERYSTICDARRGHAAMVSLVESKLSK